MTFQSSRRAQFTLEYFPVGEPDIRSGVLSEINSAQEPPPSETQHPRSSPALCFTAKLFTMCLYFGYLAGSHIQIYIQTCIRSTVYEMCVVNYYTLAKLHNTDYISLLLYPMWEQRSQELSPGG